MLQFSLALVSVNQNKSCLIDVLNASSVETFLSHFLSILFPTMRIRLNSFPAKRKKVEISELWNKNPSRFQKLYRHKDAKKICKFQKFSFAIFIWDNSTFTFNFFYFLAEIQSLFKWFPVIHCVHHDEVISSFNVNCPHGWKFVTATCIENVNLLEYPI